MRRKLSLAALSFVAAGLTLATPSVSQAQGYIGNGNPYGNFNLPGYGNYNSYGYTNPGYGFNYNNYTNFGYNGGYNGYGVQQYSQFGGFGQGGIVVHPTRLHWTPLQGLHTHGHIHVQHGFHTHRIRY